MTLKLLIGTALAVALTAGALAQAPRTGSATTPRDGVQTRAEVVERVQTMFSRMDSNRDGSLTQDETRRMARQMQGARGERAGPRKMANADPARQAERTDRAFARLDSNRDGQISRVEFAERAQARGSQMAPGGMVDRRMGRMGERMFTMADLNRDSRVSLQEATGAALQRFDRADTNRDGQLTRDERLQARRSMMGQRRG